MILLGWFMGVSAFAGWNYISKNVTGNFEDSEIWEETIPPVDGNVDRKMTINGTITRNGDLNPVTVEVNDSFLVAGNYANNRWSGLILNNGAYVEIFGDLSGSAGISVAKDATLIVHGNLSSTGSSLKVNGDVIVIGDFYTSSNTQVQNNGNLIVGGDFTHNGGGLKAKEDDIYILNPDAQITGPSWSLVEKGEYGTLTDFLEDEQGSDLADLVESIGLITSGLQWLGTYSSEWNNANNWENQEVPDAASKVIITNSGIAPVIDGDVTLEKLTLNTSATLTVNPGSFLEITGDVNNKGTIILKSTNDSLASLMLPETMTKSGLVNVNLSLEANGKWYLTAPLKDQDAGKPLVEWFYPDNDADNDWVYILRDPDGDGRDNWIRVDEDGVNGYRYLQDMENVAAWYKQEKVLDYSGNVYASEVQKTFNGKGYYMIGNPYLSAIDWDNPTGWVRDGISATMWSFFDHNGERLLQTYNNSTGVYTIFPKGYDESTLSHIPPYQSVWIKAEKAIASLTVKPSARVSQSEVPLKSIAQHISYNLIRIEADNGYLLDGAVIYFNDDFLVDAGPEDSEKQFNSSASTPEVYTRINDMAYAINGLPELDTDTLEIPLSVRNRIDSEVTLKFYLEQFADGYELYLLDGETGAITNLRQQNNYVYTPVEMGDVHDRFVLCLVKVKEVATAVKDIVEESQQFDINIINQRDYALLQISPDLLQNAEANIQVLDLSGHLVKTIQTRATETHIDLPNKSGVYMLRVSAGGVVKTEKVAR